MTTLADKIDRNANMMLWCVHVLGPDDILAAPGYAEADAYAKSLNAMLHGREGAPEDVLVFAYAAPWPQGRTGEQHASDLEEWEEFEQDNGPHIKTDAYLKIAERAGTMEQLLRAADVEVPE